MDASNVRASVKDSGGATVSLAGDEPARYIVSVAGRELKVPEADFLADTAGILLGYVAKNAAVLSKHNHFLGVWLDNGLAYLDVSISVRRLPDALRIARKNAQLAIYDAKEGKTIVL